MNHKLKEIVRLLFTRLRFIKNQLNFDTAELLSTMILGLVDGDVQDAEIITIGDGLICYDGNIEVYEQADRPDYLGYHLGEDFDTWYNTQTQRLTINGFKDLRICTDGIFSFKNFKKRLQQKNETEIINFLLINPLQAEHNNFLERRIRFIKEQWQHEVTDDLAIIRMIVT